MPFNNDIAGGNGSLVRNWIQSVNFVAGNTGWRIAKDGSAEFNSGTFRGNIEVGSLTGQHFWVNNPNTGDVIDVYNTANKLVFFIDATGRLVATSSVSTANVVINGANLLFEDTAQNPAAFTFLNASIGTDLTILNIFGGRPQNFTGGGNGSFIQLNTGDSSASEYIIAEQRGVQGKLVQTDDTSVPGTSQLMHVGTYSGNTNGTGHIIFNHGCNFTPSQAFVIGTTSGGTFANLTWGLNNLTSTQADINWTIANTGAAYATSPITFDALFIG